MSPRSVPVKWWRDPLDLEDVAELSDDDRDLLGVLGDRLQGGYPSAAMSSREIRAAMRLIRRGMMGAMFSLTEEGAAALAEYEANRAQGAS